MCSLSEDLRILEEIVCPGIVLTAENVAEGLGSPSSSVRPVLDVTDNGGREDEYPYCREQSLRGAFRSQSTTKGMWMFVK
jgi:hypothetical protein